MHGAKVDWIGWIGLDWIGWIGLDWMGGYLLSTGSRSYGTPDAKNAIKNAVLDGSGTVVL